MHNFLKNVFANNNFMKNQCDNGKFLMTASALSIGISSAMHVEAQELSRALVLEEVVVTASRREESLQQTTSSIAVLTAADIENRGLTNFTDLGEAVSGLTIDQPSSSISSAVYIRGVGTSGVSPAVQSVGVLVDGVYQPSTGAAFTELMDIERIEVLRGPQGTLFGKNTTAGVIRIFTADPDTSQFSGKIQGVLGDYDRREVRGLVNVPLVEDRLALRLSGYDTGADGHTDNLFLDTDTRNEDTQGWRAKLLWDATDDLTLKFFVQNDKRYSRMDFGLAEYGPVFLGAYGQAVANFPVSTGKSQENFPAYVSDDFDRYQFNVDWTVMNHTVSGIVSRLDATQILVQDQDMTVLNGHVFSGGLAELTGIGDRQFDTFEVQVSSDMDQLPVSYVVGYFLQKDDTVSDNQFVIPGVPPALLYRPPTLINVESNGIFGNLDFDVTESVNLSIGIRYDEDERTGSNNVVGNNHVETFDEITYALKLRYQYTNDIMVYLSHDKGFKSGGVNREFSTCNRGGRCITPDQALWDPETTLNYEVGMKGQFLENTLRINAALFFQTYEDFQITQGFQGGGANAVVSNAAEVESKGIEIEAVALVGNNFTFNSSISLINSEFTDYQGAPCAVPFAPWCVNGLQDLTGENLDHAPELSFNLGGEYRMDVGFAEMFARLDVIYKGKQNLNSIQSPFTEEDAYTVVNARLGLEEEDNWKLTLWANNLLDEDYLTAARYENVGLMQTPAKPRMLGVTMDYEF